MRFGTRKVIPQQSLLSDTKRVLPTAVETEGYHTRGSVISAGSGYPPPPPLSTTRATATAFFCTKFRQRVISRGVWSARNPDLAPSDFFLFRQLKDTVLKDPPSNVEELERIWGTNPSSFPQDVSPNVLHMFTNPLHRFKACKRRFQPLSFYIFSYLPFTTVYAGFTINVTT